MSGQSEKDRVCAMNTIFSRVVATAVVATALAGVSWAEDLGARIDLRDGWQLNSSTVVRDDGVKISTGGFRPEGWFGVSIPTTVLNALTKHGVYPDMRIGMNAYQIPDSSDEFNQQHDLARFSHLPDKRNPWRDPWWFRKEFTLPGLPADQRVWLHFNCINYRAEVWLNGRQIADSSAMVGMFRRFDFDITGHAKVGENVLAVKIFPVDHPGVPDKQTEPLGKDRGYHKEIMKDVTMVMTIGYDCMPTVPDRNMGIIQDVWVDWTGAVAIRDPFVVTELPLPKTDRATLRISTELVNATDARVQGVLRGSIAGTGVKFEQAVQLGPNETKEVIVAPNPVMRDPRLWWPRGYGEQALYDMSLVFATGAGGTTSDEKKITFGVRQIASEMHERNGSYGRRVIINGQKIFCRGGYIQPEILFDWDAQRMETEIRYFAEANLNLVYFEDIPNPPDAFLDICDRYGLMFGNCFYGCYWTTPGSDYPLDTQLLARGTVDIIKRYRNHPSLVLYMAMNEGDTREDVYTPWRKEIIARDGTRLFIPSGSMPDSRKDVPEWIRPDLPVGMNDDGPRTYGWVEPAVYFDWVREEGGWMFRMENGSPSVPPMSSLAQFIPTLLTPSERFAPDAVWAHHDACHYFQPYDEALRRLHGEATSATDYAWKAHLLTADQHRAMFEAVNHRSWDITSGFTQWKINSCWPSVEWQIFDWYLKPMVSWFYIKRANEPLHVQLNLPDGTISVINTRLTQQTDLTVRARVFDLSGKLLWEKAAAVSAPAHAYRESFVVPEPPGATPVYFVKLELSDAQGRLVSDNFYWLRAKGTGDYTALAALPPVTLKSTCAVEARDADRLARVRVTNPTTQLAFFIQVALTKGPGGEEILPVFWEDNYFSLLPGESREITARFAAKDAGQTTPSLEVGGWNVEGEVDCAALAVSPSEIKTREPLKVTATIVGTFLDGSRVTLRLDDKPLASQWAWARNGRAQEIVFPLELTQPGRHTITVGKSRLELDIRP
jgi:hypothetical protein